MTKPAKAQPREQEPDGPAVVRREHVQDRELSTVAGAPRGYRVRDGLAWMVERKQIHGHQLEAGRRLQEDYARAMDALFPKSRMERGGGSGRAPEVSNDAIDAKARVTEALSVLPPELLSMTVLFLFPDFEQDGFSVERIAARVREDKRAIGLGVRASLSLLARHYGR